MDLVLPYPASLNRLYQRTRKADPWAAKYAGASTGGKGVVRTKAYAAWAKRAGNALLPQLVGDRPEIGECQIWWTVTRPDGRRRDLDNLLKGPCDLLQEMRVIRDDALIQQHVVTWEGANLDAPRINVRLGDV